MPQVDFEAAWHDLAEVIASRESGWGTRNLLAEMTRLQGRHRLSESLLDRVVRLYGVGRLLGALINEAGDHASGADGTSPSRARADSPGVESLGGSDGGSTAAVREPVGA